MRVRTLLDPNLITNDPTEATNFTTTDHHGTDLRDDGNLSVLQVTGTEIQDDPDHTNNLQTINWLGMTSSRSIKTCTLTDSSGDFVNCTDVNLHYLRNFTTTQSAE